MKVGLVSLGCPKNLVDSEVMLGLVREAGHEITTDASRAEVIVVNTCAFIDPAKQESVEAILEMAAFKRAGSCARLVVTGCLAERYREQLRADIPEIDALLGTGEVPRIVEAIDPFHAAPETAVRFFRGVDELQTATNPESRPAAPPYLYDADTPRVLTTPRHYAYVKVAEGCDYACSFCTIPKLRGRYRSRSADSIVNEVHGLVSRGVREVILISQDTTFYGVDRGERGALACLLRRLNMLDGLEWIRLLYLYPTTVAEHTLDAVAECHKVCKYIDLPLQHVTPAVLSRMRRPGTRRTYARLLQQIRDRVPGVTLRTTFIVGFPGERPEDFTELCDFVRETRFDHVGAFTYSHEEGTAAYGMADEIPAAVKQRRRQALLALQRRIVDRSQRTRIGQTVRVMIDGPTVESSLVLQGRTQGQAPDIDSVVYLTDCDPTLYEPGRVIPAEIVATRGYDVVARPLPEPQPT